MLTVAYWSTVSWSSDLYIPLPLPFGYLDANSLSVNQLDSNSAIRFNLWALGNNSVLSVMDISSSNDRVTVHGSRVAASMCVVTRTLSSVFSSVSGRLVSLVG